MRKRSYPYTVPFIRLISASIANGLDIVFFPATHYSLERMSPLTSLDFSSACQGSISILLNNSNSTSYNNALMIGPWDYMIDAGLDLSRALSGEPHLTFAKTTGKFGAAAHKNGLPISG